MPSGDAARPRPGDGPHAPPNSAEGALLKAGALQRAILNSANFSSIATDASGVIQIFNVGAAPVVVLTTTDDRMEIQRCYDLGCNVYVTKPVDYEKFANAIRQLGMFVSVIKVPEAT